jgi:hypothetical protein
MKFIDGDEGLAYEIVEVKRRIDLLDHAVLEHGCAVAHR